MPTSYESYGDLTESHKQALYWNVQGLRKKLLQVIFICFLRQYDVIALSETWIEEKHFADLLGKLPNEYSWHLVPAIREKPRGRASGGMLLGVRRDLESKDFQSNCIGSWASIKARINNTWFCFISIYNNTSLAHMKEELDGHLQRNSMYPIIMGGDLNGKIGSLGAEGGKTKRPSMDQKINKEGKQWLNLMHRHNCSILNGNVEGDLKGQYTRQGHAKQANSVLDYVGANTAARMQISFFKVGDHSYGSDHFPLEITIATE